MCLIIPILNYFLGRYEKHSITSQVTSFLCIPKRTFIGTRVVLNPRRLYSEPYLIILFDGGFRELSTSGFSTGPFPVPSASLEYEQSSRQQTQWDNKSFASSLSSLLPAFPSLVFLGPFSMTFGRVIHVALIELVN